MDGIENETVELLLEYTDSVFEMPSEKMKKYLLDANWEKTDFYCDFYDQDSSSRHPNKKKFDISLGNMSEIMVYDYLELPLPQGEGIPPSKRQLKT